MPFCRCVQSRVIGGAFQFDPLSLGGVESPDSHSRCEKAGCTVGMSPICFRSYLFVFAAILVYSKVASSTYFAHSFCFNIALHKLEPER